MSELMNDFILLKPDSGRIGFLNNARGHERSESLDDNPL
jgi:hypothetical protein